MAAITIEPTNKTGCYQALNYTYTNTIIGNSNPMSIEVDVKIAGASFRTLFLVSYISRTESGGDYTYTFRFDISKVVQSFFDNNQFFYDSAKTYPYTAAALVAAVVVDVYRWEPDTNGVLTRNATPTTSNPLSYFNSLKNDMAVYLGAVGRKFLTKKTDYRLSKQVTNLIAIYSDADVTHLRINASGDVVTLAMTSGQINIFNLNDYIAAATATLVIQGGVQPGETFNGTSEILTFSVLDDICDPVGLHFQSELGTAEVFLFKDYEYGTENERDSDLYVTDSDLVRMYKGQIEKIIEIQKRGFFDGEWTFFQDVVTSSIFYVEQPTGTLLEVYATFKTTPFRTPSGAIDINLRFSYSNEQKIFEN